MLHGRGGTAQSIASLAEAISDSQFHIIIPQAENHTWYPYSFMEEEVKNEPYLSLSIEAIKGIIDQTALTTSKENIYIAGFSQGACLTLEVAARYATKYGGIAAFTGGLIGKKIHANHYRGDFENTQVFISNGDNDPHIPLNRSLESKKALTKMGANVTLKIYPGKPHTITEDEISIVRGLFTLA